ncbi:PAS domain-containing sensor histidine kinase [Pleomorphovibrio marinus]|uniref:PAS domain-containing sensor histidine kinase n=1 Tax=Pleomorphovibrio marinus TaxID=2164132 RepID=UPI000E0C552D|nr:PAS domain-containing sensor histidine kinase [Pleomorphovibrio marinus]
MVEAANYGFKNLLLTIKKHDKQTFELLYVSKEVFLIAQEGEKVFKEDFYNRIFPSMPRPVFETFFEKLGKGENLLVPILLDKSLYMWVRIEGYTISQHDGTYLINAMVTPHRESSTIQSWLYRENKEQFFANTHNLTRIIPENLSELEDYLRRKFEKFDLVNSGELEKKREKTEYELVPGVVKLSKIPLGNGYYSIQMELLDSPIQGEGILSDPDNQEIIDQFLGVVYYEYSPESKKIAWSGAVTELLGYEKEDFLSISIWDWLELIHPEDRAFNGLLYHTSDGGTDSFENIYRVRHKDGHFIFVRDSVKTFFHFQKAEKILVGMIKDVSALKMAEEKIKEHQANLTELTAVVPGMVYMLRAFEDHTHKYLYVSQGCKAIFGVEPEEVIATEKALADLIHPEDRDHIEKQDKEAYLNGNKFEAYFRIITPEGNIKWIYGTSDKIRNDSNESIWAGVYIDITETKKKEEEAKENFVKYKSIFDESPHIIIHFDQNLLITDVNKTYLEKTKKGDKSEILGKNVECLVKNPSSKAAFKMTLENGFGRFEGYDSEENQLASSYYRISAKEIKKGESYQAIIEDITEKEFVQNFLNEVTNTSTVYNDKDFFDEVAKLLNSRLNFEYCLIGHIHTGTGYLETISAAKKDEIIPNFSLPHPASPKMIQEQDVNALTIIPEKAYQEFPQDSLLVENKLESYIAFAINNKQGEPIGLLAAAGKDKISIEKPLKDIFKFLGDWVGSELHRYNYELGLLETNLMQDAILNGTDYAIFAVNHNMEITLFNNRTLNVFEIDKLENLLTKTLIKDNAEISVMEMIGETVGQHKTDYFLIKSPNGKLRELKISITQISYGQKQKISYVVFADDITERTESEKKLIETEQLYRSISENFPKGTIDVLDKSYKYIYTEGKEYQLQGIQPKSLIGLSHVEQYQGKNKTLTLKNLKKVLEGEMVNYEITINNQSYLQRGVPLTNNKGEIDRILLVKQNITDAKKLEAEKETLIQDLKSHNEELLRFAYIVSHNLRAPIVNIALLLDLYNETNPADMENVEVIENLKISTNLLNATLQDLIEVVSIKKQKIPKVETIDFKLLLNNIEKSLFNQLKESGIKIHKDFSQLEEMNYVYAHLENFLMNFLTNAVKYRHPDRTPEVWISTYVEGEHCVIRFEDNGIGLDLKRYGDRIFGLYQRFHNHVEGKGMGLYLVREQIRANDGKIEINSEVGKGTEFKVSLKNLKIPKIQTTP